MGLKIYSPQRTYSRHGRLSLLPAILPGSVFQISKHSWRPAKVWSYIYSAHLFHHDQASCHPLTQTHWHTFWHSMDSHTDRRGWHRARWSTGGVFGSRDLKKINRQLLILSAELYKKKKKLFPKSSDVGPNVTTKTNGTAVWEDITVEHVESVRHVI